MEEDVDVINCSQVQEQKGGQYISGKVTGVTEEYGLVEVKILREFALSRKAGFTSVLQDIRYSFNVMA